MHATFLQFGGHFDTWKEEQSNIFPLNMGKLFPEVGWWFQSTFS